MTIIEVPNNRPISDEEIFEKDSQKSKFDQKLEEFVQDINYFRNNIGL